MILNNKFIVNHRLMIDFLLSSKIFIFLLSFLSLINIIESEILVDKLNISLFSSCSTLLNGNNIMVYRYGISIFKTSFLSPIYQYNFTSENQLSSSVDINKIEISQFSFNYKEPITNDNINEKIKNEDTIIIILSKNNLYVLSPNGKFIFSDDLSKKLDGQYYNLIPYKIDSVNKYYYYFIIFSNSNKQLVIFYYKIELNNKKNILLYNYTTVINSSIGQTAEAFFSTLSCQMMSSFDYDHYILVCYCRNNYPGEMNILFFDVNNNNNSISFIRSKYKDPEDIIVLKTNNNYYKNITHICYIKGDVNIHSYGNCMDYYINNDTFGDEVHFFDNCISSHTSLFFSYLNNINQYILSCHQQMQYISYTFLDDNFNPLYNKNNENAAVFKAELCYNFVDISIIFNKLNKSFSIFYECNSGEGGDVYQYSIDDLELNITINYYFEEENESKVEEEIEEETNEKIEKEFENYNINKNYYFYNDTKIYVDKCPNDYPFEIILSKECIKECSFNDLLDGNIKSNEFGIEKTYNIIQNYISGNISNITNDITITGYNTIYQITTTSNQNNDNYDDNISVIKLNECEDILKEVYSIPKNLSLIILKIDIKRNDSITTEVEYEVYNPITKEKLDLNYCNNTPITIYAPIEMSENMVNKYDSAAEQGYNIYNSNDSFYNDICTRYKSENGTDVSINDRKSDFYDNNITLCEEGCEYIDINTTNKKVHCECNVKTVVNTDININVFNFSKLIEGFYDFENLTNLKIIYCLKLVFSKLGESNNYCSYLIIIIFFGFIIGMSFNIYNGMNSIKITIYKMIKEILSNEGFMQKNKPNNLLYTSLNFNSRKIIKNKKCQNFTNKEEKSSQRVINSFFKESIPIKSCPPKNVISIFVKKTKTEKNIGNESSNKINKLYKSSNTKAINNKKNKKNNNYISSVKTFHLSHNKNKNLYMHNKTINKKIYKNDKSYISVELNNLEYKKAIEVDKRKFCQYYFSLILNKQLILFTFVTRNDYNIPILKINLFLLIISILLVVNAVFFNDDTMHAIYTVKGKYDFLYQIPQTIYSSIISFTLNNIFKALALSQNDILNLKKLNYRLVGPKVKKVLQGIKIKIIFFYLIGFMLLIFIWYYLAAFGAVYYNTQRHLFIDSTISFIIHMSYPFIINIIPAALRTYALKDKNHKNEIAYKISQTIAVI